MKKNLWIIALLLVMTFALAACNNAGNNQDENGSNDNSSNDDQLPDNGSDDGSDDSSNDGSNVEEAHTHAASDAIMEKMIEATCTTDGSYDEVVYCSDADCGAELSRETKTVPALGHNHIKTVVSEHTETSEGEVRYECSACGDSYTEYDKHSYTSSVVNPTCQIGGYTKYVCKCGNSYSDNHTNPLPHNIVEFSEEAIAAGDWMRIYYDGEFACSCELDVEYYPVCVDCGTKLTENKYIHIVPAPGHYFDPNGWRHAEKMPGESPCLQQDIWVNACSNCYDNSWLHIDCVDIMVRGSAPGHTWGEWITVSTPTVNTSGEYIRLCTICCLAEYGAQVVSDSVVLPALNDVDYTYAVVSAPSTTNDGLATYIYTLYDGTSIVIEVTIPALGENDPSDDHDPAPKKEDCWITESDNTIYYTYKCNHCGDWIVAYSESKLGCENGVHNIVDFSMEAVANGQWIKLNISGSVCPCEADTLYYPICQDGCGTDFSSPEFFGDYGYVLPAPGHVYDYDGWKHAEKKPGESPCLQQDVWINTCIVCYAAADLTHIGCVLTEVRCEAPGHSYGAWNVVVEPTLSTGGIYVRFCSVCSEPQYGSQTISQDLNVPALNEVDYTYGVTLAPDCVTPGIGVYTYNADPSIKVEVAIDPTGHHIEYGCDYSVVLPTDSAAGEAHITCADCDVVLVILLPVLSDENYTIIYGNCFQPYDIYIIDVKSGDCTISIEFEVYQDYCHDEAPAKDECVITEGVGCIYYSYLCSKCNSWVIAYVENK